MTDHCELEDHNCEGPLDLYWIEGEVAVRCEYHGIGYGERKSTEDAYWRSVLPEDCESESDIEKDENK